MLKRAVLKAYHSPYWIPGLSVVAVAALMLASFTVVQYIRAEAQDDRERLDADLASCERGNVARNGIREMGEANAALVTRILEASFARADTPEEIEAADRFREQIQPLFDDYAEVVSQFQPVDCQAIVPGGTG